MRPGLVAAAAFESMKTQGAGAPARHRDGGEGRTFLNKGTNGRWKDVLTPDDITSYRTRAAQELPPALNAWLENGRRGGDPKAMAD